MTDPAGVPGGVPVDPRTGSTSSGPGTSGPTTAAAGGAPAMPPPPPPPPTTTPAGTSTPAPDTAPPPPGAVPVGAVPQPPPPPVVTAAGTVARMTADEVSALTRAWFSRLDPTGWRPTLAVAGVIAALVLGMQLLNAVIPARASGGGGGTDGGGQGPVAGTPLRVAQGVTIYPAGGWTVADRRDVPGSESVRLVKGDVEFHVALARDPGVNAGQLFNAVIEGTIRPQSVQLTVVPPTLARVGNVTGAVGSYQGLFKPGGSGGAGGGVPFEGRVWCAVIGNGRALVIIANAQSGSLGRVEDELELMVSTAEVEG